MIRPISPRCLLFLVIVLALTVAGCSIEATDMAGVAVEAVGEDRVGITPSEGAEIDDPLDSEEPVPGGSSESTDPAEPAPADNPGADQTDQLAAIGSSGIGDRYYPTYGNGGYDVSHYDLNLRWDPDNEFLDAVATVDLTADQPLGRFNFDFIGFEIAEILVNGQLAGYERDGRELSILPAAPIVGDSSVVIDYSGQPGPVPVVGAPFSAGWTELDNSIVVIGEPEGAEGWYPVNGHPLDKATYRISITTSADLTVASNGTIVEERRDGDLLTTVFESVHPQASYLTTLAIGDFVRFDAEPSESGVPVRHYFDRSQFDNAVATMAPTAAMIDAFSALFGPYPFENYGTIVVEEDLGFALETQTLSVFGADLVDGDPFNEEIVAHELAHQWFGNHVSLAQWSDIWLNEGFANYSQFLWREAADPSYDIDAAVRADYDDFGAFLTVPPGAPDRNDLFNGSVYARGGFTLHALRTTIGEDAFFRLLRTYVEEFGGGNATTDDFIGLAQDISGQDLTTFFDEWLFQQEVPPLPR